MATPSIAAPCANRNKSVLKFRSIFEQVLRYVANSKNNCESKSNCLQSLETLIDLGYKAVKEHGINSDIESYQQHFKSYIYHSSIYLVKQTQAPQVFDDHVYLIAQSLANMLVLAENNFAKLGYPSYYQDFAKAIEVLFEYVGGGSEVCEFDAGRC